MELLTLPSLYPSPPNIKKKKIYHPIQDTPPHPTHIGGKGGARHALGSGKKPGTEKEAGLVLSFLVRLPAASAAAIHRWVPSAFARRAMVLLCCRLTSTEVPGECGCEEVQVGRSRDRGLRCQRPPPLEVGREQIHLCCLLFFWTCPAICLSLSRSPATGRL